MGCGRSTHLPDAPADFWTVELFKDELVDVTHHLGIADRYVVVGQSWGGMLALEHALDHPLGGWYGLKKGLRGRFGIYLPPLLEGLGTAEVEHNPRSNRMRAV